MAATTDQVARVIEQIAGNTLQYALLLAAIGTVSMAFLELIKSLFRLRMRFHRWRLHRWLPDQAAREELMLLAAGGSENAEVLFDQPIERMMGQIQAAANMALDFPGRYPRVYAFLTSAPSGAGDTDDGKLWADFASRVAREGRPRPEPPTPALPGDAEARQAREAAEERQAQQARARIGNLLARRLDAFQNTTQYLWARLNQTASVAIGTALAAYAIGVSSTFAEANDFLATIGLALLAGMLAPFAKDLVSALSGLRAR